MGIPLSNPDITELERQAVLQVLRSSQLALGPRLDEFEQKIAAYHERSFAVAVNSGTSGLHLTMLALSVQPGDEVITSPFSFIASTNCILYVDAIPRFVDIDPHTWNLDVDRLDGALTRDTKGILPIHIFGLPCPMLAINEYAHANRLWVVEDACEAIGGYSAETIVGKDADLSVLAFYPNKQLTTGEGGIVLTDASEHAHLCRSLRNQGRGDDCSWLNHERLGYNYRMSELSAALGIVQLSRIDEILQRRAAVAEQYMERLADCPWLRFQKTPDGFRKSWFVFVTALADEFTGEDRDLILDDLRAAGIGCNNYFTPIHLQPFMRQKFGFQPGDFPVCEQLAQRTIALPFFNRLNESQIDFVCDRLHSSLAVHAEAGARLRAKSGVRWMQEQPEVVEKTLGKRVVKQAPTINP